MAADFVLETALQVLDRTLQALVLEGTDLTTPIADDVVVMMAAGNDRLVQRATISGIDSLHQAHSMEEVQGTIDACQPHVRPLLREPDGNLPSRETATLPGKQVHDCAARAAAAATGALQRLVCPVVPSGAAVSHLV